MTSSRTHTQTLRHTHMHAHMYTHTCLCVDMRTYARTGRPRNSCIHTPHLRLRRLQSVQGEACVCMCVCVCVCVCTSLASTRTHTLTRTHTHAHAHVFRSSNVASNSGTSSPMPRHISGGDQDESVSRNTSCTYTEISRQHSEMSTSSRELSSVGPASISTCGER